MAILDETLVCYSCQFYSLSCSIYEDQCRTVEWVLSILYFIGFFIAMIYLNRFRNLNLLLRHSEGRIEEIYTKRKLFFCITGNLTFLICGIRCLLLSSYSTTNASMNIYILVLACTYLLGLIMGVQFNSILLFWIEFIILHQTLSRYSIKLEIAKKVCVFIIVGIIIFIIVIVIMLYVDLTLGLFLQNIYYGLLCVCWGVIFTGLLLTGIKMRKLFKESIQSQRTVKLLSYHVLLVCICLLLILPLATMVAFFPIPHTDLLAQIGIFIYFVFNLNVIVILSPIKKVSSVSTVIKRRSSSNGEI